MITDNSRSDYLMAGEMYGMERNVKKIDTFDDRDAHYDLDSMIRMMDPKEKEDPEN